MNKSRQSVFLEHLLREQLRSSHTPSSPLQQRIKELETSEQRLKEEVDEAVEVISEYKVANKTLKNSVASKDPDATVILQGMRCLQKERAKAKGESELQTKTTEDFLAKAAVAANPAGGTIGKLTESVDL